MPKKFLFYVDPGHGYLRVPLALLEELGITKLISNYSTKCVRFAYLEEDLDAVTFSKAYEKKFGSPVETVVKYMNHMAGFRNKERFSRTQEFEWYKSTGYELA
jgi:hypothetical protein